MNDFPKPTGIVLTVPTLNETDPTEPIQWCGQRCELLTLESLRAKSNLAEAVRYRTVLEWIDIALETGIYPIGEIRKEIDWALGRPCDLDTDVLAWGDCLGLQARKAQRIE